MPNYRRYRIPGGCYFFTVNLLERRRALLVDEIEWLREVVRVVKQKRPFYIDAWVVLPDHMHCIWTLPPDDVDYSGRWRDIKTRFAKGLAANEHRTSVRKKRHERGIWQRRFWEHTIRDDVDYARHVDYIHYNPVKHGYVQRTFEWPYSTFKQFVRKGFYSPDWAYTPDIDFEVNEPQ